jgi:hypothetical protein
MGKNRTIKTLIWFVTNLIEHKIISKFGERKLAKHFVDSEINAYRDSAVEEASKYNWNDYDKGIIKLQSIDKARNGLKKDYPDVNFLDNDLVIFADETIKEVLG